MFADDSKCFSKISTLKDGLNFQQDISVIKLWGDSWGMSFDTTKCKILRISRSFNPVIHPNQMGNILIGPVDSCRDLGFTVTKDLSWKVHIDSITEKANRSLGFIKRTRGFKAPMQAKKLLYVSMVRSKLEVGVPVWSAFHKIKIEGVQRRATRFIVRPNMDYKGRLVSCSLLPLSLRREMLDITFLFKCRQGLQALDPSDVANQFHPMRRTRRSDKGPIYTLPLCKTGTFAKFF